MEFSRGHRRHGRSGQGGARLELLAVTHLYAFLMMDDQSWKAEVSPRAKMKSNFFVHVQSFSRSSNSKLQFGGTLADVN